MTSEAFSGPDQSLGTADPIEVLVVDDDHSLRESCASLLKSEGLTPTVCRRADDALRMLRKRRFDILLVDQQMPRMSGLDILESALGLHPEVIGIVMTANPSVESSVAVLRAGAWDYLPKPFSATHFSVLVGRAAHAVVSSRQSAVRDTSREPTPQEADPGLIGKSPALRRVVELATKVARTDASVFITGESGAGKEVIAQFVHRNSRRKDQAIVSVNCAAIPEALLESEMFGHVEGAFTGAVRAKAGLLEVADGSTLFLDELTELPLPTQAKLLRVLQDGIVRRVGSTKTDAVVDIRVIAATNRDPIEAISAGALRKDLYYRLRVVPIHIPPLRDRPEDIEALATDFMREFWIQHREKGSTPPTFSEAALQTLRSARWPGNVRELRNVIEHLVVLADPGQELGESDIVFIDESLGAPTAEALYDEALLEEDYHTAREHVLTRFEVDYLQHVVQSSGGNISDAARMAGVDRTTLYRLMEKHGLRRKADAEPGN